jgi:predicted RNA-binding protein YlqC (UPF0109 family)
MRLKFEKDRKNIGCRVVVDHSDIGKITLKGEEDWRVKVSFKGEAFKSNWPSLNQAQNEVRRIIGK